MLRIVVADDEFYARKALIRKINLAQPDAEIVADFENGEMAIRYIREHKGKVDLLFTDVRMPEMDGLELARCISEEELGVETIIVSGYSEFEYAKKAMTFGVNNYLIKPVQEDELSEALERLKKKTIKYEEKVSAQMSQRTVEYLSISELAGHEEWRKQFLQPVFQKYGFDDEMGRMPFRGCYLAVLQAENGDQKRDLVEKELNRFLINRDGCSFYFRRYKEYVALLFTEKEPETDLLEFIKRINAKYDVKMTVGISQKYIRTAEMKKAYQEAVYAINQRLINGWVKVYAYTSEMRPENHFTKEAEMMLRDAIAQKQCSAAGCIISDVLESCGDSYSLYITISGIFNLLYRIFCKSARSEAKDSEHAYMLFSYKSDLYGFRYFSEVEDYVKKIVESMCQEQEEKTHHYIVAELLDYIEKNYQNNISLSELAEHKYFMNSSYLSRLFKNEVGQTFSKYLMEFRLRKAANLLENELLKINDVAMLVGYNDVSHFIQYFKKIYGCTPEEYRRKKLEGSNYV